MKYNISDKLDKTGLKAKLSCVMVITVQLNSSVELLFLTTATQMQIYWALYTNTDFYKNTQNLRFLSRFPTPDKFFCTHYLSSHPGTPASNTWNPVTQISDPKYLLSLASASTEILPSVRNSRNTVILPKQSEVSDTTAILRTPQANKEDLQTYYILKPLPDIQQHQTSSVKAPGALYSKNEK